MKTNTKDLLEVRHVLDFLPITASDMTAQYKISTGYTSYNGSQFMGSLSTMI